MSHFTSLRQEHDYRRVNPGSKEVTVNKAYWDGKKKNYPPAYIVAGGIPDNVPYTLAVLHLVEGMTIDVSQEK